ncbi:GNAT family N-acetyltransferase [Spirosoma areae]
MLDTERLLIRPFSVDDAGFVLELLNTPSWLAFIGDRNVKTTDDARQYILDGPLTSYERFGFGPYVVELKSTAVPIGLCGLHKRETLADIDIGFAFLPEYTGKGYGYEAASAVISYGNTVLGLTRVTGITKPTNQNSIRLLEKLGLLFEKRINFSADGKESLLFGKNLADLKPL